MTLSSLINIGIQYWAVKKEVIGLVPDKYIYTLPVGANDALNVLYRTMTRPTGSYSSSAGGKAALAGDNFLQLFFGWEGVGLASYLLIGFWFKKESAVTSDNIINVMRQ